jgi:adenylate cyclase
LKNTHQYDYTIYIALNSRLSTPNCFVMAFEIERKFLVLNDNWRAKASTGTFYRQGYLSFDKRCAVRVRMAGGRGFISVKSQEEGRFTRREFDYEIPLKDAEEMIEALCDYPPVDKIRYMVEEAGMTWEIDVFTGANDGLVVAEIELESEDQPFRIPDWAGAEVTHDERYLNVSLYLHPFKEWSP